MVYRRALSLDRSLVLTRPLVAHCPAHFCVSRRTAMVIGIDSHKGTLAACAVDGVGRQEAATEFPNSRPGHAALLDWALQLPGDHVFAIEGFGWIRSIPCHPPRTSPADGGRGSLRADRPRTPAAADTGQVGPWRRPCHRQGGTARGSPPAAAQYGMEPFAS